MRVVVVDHLYSCICVRVNIIKNHDRNKTNKLFAVSYTIEIQCYTVDICPLSNTVLDVDRNWNCSPPSGLSRTIWKVHIGDHIDQCTIDQFSSFNSLLCKNSRAIMKNDSWRVLKEILWVLNIEMFWIFHGRILSF